MEFNKKHTDVVDSMDEFNRKFEEGIYAKPWIVYVGDGSGGYSVIYSNDEGKVSTSPDFAELITHRVEKLEDEKVFCTESEYEILVTTGTGWVTDTNGNKTEVEFDSSKMYYIYEE